MSQIYNKEYYKEHYTGDFGIDGDTYRNQMIAKALLFKKAFNPRSSLELGCANGIAVEALRNLGVEAYGIDLAKDILPDKPYYFAGNVANIEWPITELVHSSDILEHLTDKEIDIVLDKCSVTQNMFHSISTSFDEYGDITWLKDMDKGHIAMHSPSWWLKKFNDKFVERYFITTMSRTDFVSAEYQKYKFSNTVFMLTKESMSMLAHL